MMVRECGVVDFVVVIVLLVKWCLLFVLKLRQFSRIFTFELSRSPGEFEQLATFSVGRSFLCCFREIFVAKSLFSDPECQKVENRKIEK